MRKTIVHPRTGEALTPIGYIRGKAIWPILGADDNPPPADPLKPPDNTDVTAQLKALQDENAQFKAQIQQLTADKGKTEQEKQSHQALLDKIAKIFDPEKGKLDPEKLAQEITDRDTKLAERDAKLKELQLESTVRSLAGDAADSLLDSRSFMSAANAFDSTDEKYNDKLKSLVEKHKPKTPIKSGGADHTGGSNGGGSDQLTKEDLDKMTKAKDWAGITKARSEGKFNTLMGVK